MENGVIYCTTNLVNGKKYIGQDSKNDPEYLGSSTILHRAIKKYGKENFEKEILQDGVTLKKDLDESEIYWIDYFGAVKSDLFYNISSGGTGGELGPEVRKIQSESAKKVSYNSSRFIKGVGSKPFRNKISLAKKGKPWSELLRKNNPITYGKFAKNRKEVVQLDENLNLVKTWDFVQDADINFCKHKVGSDHLASRCRRYRNLGELKLYKGFYWIFKEDYERDFRR